MNGLRGAVALLTRFPARPGAPTSRAVAWLPVVGAAIGGVVAVVYAAARVPIGSGPAAVLAIGAGILLTGALHEDGLADTADAFGAGLDREGTLAVLKDPRHGTYGVLALVLGLLARVAAIAALTGLGALAAVPAAHASSRAGAAWMLGRWPAAMSEGLGAAFVRPSRRHVVAAVAFALALAAALLGPWALVAVPVAFGPAWVMGRLAMGRIGGITGDVLGAAQQLGEIGVLFLAAAAAGGIPWWRV